MQDYEDIPYQGLSFADTHPDRLAVLGRLFGLTPAAVEQCRVLELGCAEGGNLIPLACALPAAEFVGIELSPSQADKGMAKITELGLSNIRIHQGDILELGAELGQFDYIVAQGVFSWVEANVRDKLLATTRQLLRSNGLAYISYNTNPGWRLRGVLRDMLLYHVRGTEKPRQRLALAQELLPRVAATLEGVNTPLAQYLKSQIARLGNEDPSYLYHEFLAPANQPMLFSEFVQQAGRHGLNYVCDSELYTMFASSLGGQAASFIEGFEDLIEQEQYMDFLRGRGFRQSVLCHDSETPDYDIDVSVLEQFAVYADVQTPQNPRHKSGKRQRKTQTFTTAAGERFSIQEPLTAAILEYLGNHYPDAVALPELFELVKPQFPVNPSQSFVESKGLCLGELFNLFANGVVGLSTRARHFAAPNLEKPVVCALARLQAAQGDTVTTVWHGNINVDHFAARFIHYLDGSCGLEDIVEKLVIEVSNGTLEPIDDANSVSANSTQRLQAIRELITTNCQRLLTLFAHHGLFETDTACLHGHAA
jgi:methyltransferase-like protein/SAM-dependent methyltransferase